MASKVGSQAVPSAAVVESYLAYQVDLSVDTAPLFSGTAQEFVITSVWNKFCKATNEHDDLAPAKIYGTSKV